MRKSIYLKIFSRVLLVVMLTVMVSSVYGSARAMQSHMTKVSGRVSHPGISAAHQCPCAPHEQHKDHDGCNTCMNSACHTPLAIQQFHLNYSPIISDLRMSDPLTHLPEVYIPKFIPPQNLV